MPRNKKLPANVRRHGPGFRAVVTVGGKRLRSQTFADVEAAVEWLENWRVAKATPVERPIVLTLADGVALLESELALDGARPGTVRFYSHHAKILQRYMGAETAVADIGPDDIQRFIATRLSGGVKGATIVAKDLLVLRRIRALAVVAGHDVGPDPFIGVRMPRVEQKRMAALTKAQVAEIVGQIRASGRRNAGWHADIVEAVFGTGLRRTELGKVAVRDIDFERGFIRVDGKTGPREQTFSTDLEPVLRRLCQRARKDGRLVSGYRFIADMFADWKRKLGLPDFSPHVIRHSYGTEMADHVHQLQLMYLLGHKTVQMTSRYFHGRGSAVRDALGALRIDPPSPPPAAAEGDKESPSR